MICFSEAVDFVRGSSGETLPSLEDTRLRLLVMSVGFDVIDVNFSKFFLFELLGFFVRGEEVALGMHDLSTPALLLRVSQALTEDFAAKVPSCSL